MRTLADVFRDLDFSSKEDLNTAMRHLSEWLDEAEDLYIKLSGCECKRCKPENKPTDGANKK